jgi:hypothetical protein
VIVPRAWVYSTGGRDWTEQFTEECKWAAEHCLCPGCNGTDPGACEPDTMWCRPGSEVRVPPVPRARRPDAAQRARRQPRRTGGAPRVPSGASGPVTRAAPRVGLRARRPRLRVLCGHDHDGVALAQLRDPGEAAARPRCCVAARATRMRARGQTGRTWLTARARGAQANKVRFRKEELAEGWGAWLGWTVFFSLLFIGFVVACVAMGAASVFAMGGAAETQPLNAQA